MRLSLVEPVDLVANKTKWLGALDEAERFIHAQPPSEQQKIPDRKRHISESSSTLWEIAQQIVRDSSAPDFEYNSELRRHRRQRLWGVDVYTSHTGVDA